MKCPKCSRTMFKEEGGYSRANVSAGFGYQLPESYSCHNCGKYIEVYPEKEVLATFKSTTPKSTTPKSTTPKSTTPKSTTPKTGGNMRESSLWQYIKQGMLGKWHVTRVESSAGNGVPDVSYGMSGKNGWIELKYIKEWPKRPTTKVKLPLRPEQKHWIKNRGQLSGSVWVICRIEDTFFLISWASAVYLTNEGAIRAEWNNWSTLVWDDHINFEELAMELNYGH